MKYEENCLKRKAARKANQNVPQECGGGRDGLAIAQNLKNNKYSEAGLKENCARRRNGVQGSTPSKKRDPQPPPWEAAKLAVALAAQLAKKTASRYTTPLSGLCFAHHFLSNVPLSGKVIAQAERYKTVFSLLEHPCMEKSFATYCLSVSAACLIVQPSHCQAASGSTPIKAAKCCTLQANSVPRFKLVRALLL